MKTCPWCGPLEYHKNDGHFYMIYWSKYMSDWFTLPFHFFPSPAVYVIYEKNEVVYVGSTSNLRDRLKVHRKGILSELQYPSVKYSFTKHYGDWLMRETRLIRRLKPQYNSSRGIRERGSYGV